MIKFWLYIFNFYKEIAYFKMRVVQHKNGLINLFDDSLVKWLCIQFIPFLFLNYYRHYWWKQDSQVKVSFRLG